MSVQMEMNAKYFSMSTFTKAYKKIYSKVKKINVIFDSAKIKKSSIDIPYIRPVLFIIDGQRIKTEDIAEILGYDTIFINLKQNQVQIITDKYKYYVLSVNTKLTGEYHENIYYQTTLHFIQDKVLIEEIDTLRYNKPVATEWNDNE